jgi:hypothetical protein
MAKEIAMWPDVSILLREFARRPTIDRPERADPVFDMIEFGFLDALARWFAPLFEPPAAPSS